MLDEREGDVKPEERARAFNRKPVGARIFIVLAGPVANFGLAFLLWHVALVGIGAAFARRVGYGESAGSCAISCAGCIGLILIVVLVFVVLVVVIVGAAGSGGPPS